ncbi:hypothetical protein [Streptomyces cylindrosporus]|uniref:Uncharacterized protein n=1 Tax=Streptomyces cylindrosporus TaxID=2927583 RepID=A0ABS9YJQ2_9ACTN|nr:hypothetical protein [Streptomyces cylindrosporus]MCI3277482.1 hypothetical protein [Streptomyces cylindrosporus]
MIRNTTHDAQNPGDSMLFLAASMGPGGVAQAVDEQERAGQAQLVNSTQLPTDLRGGSREDFEAVGFQFGEPTPGDHLFMEATLPDGWTRQASDHPMGSYIVDEHGRQRVSIFYKAAYYDRSAHMTLTSHFSYVYGCVQRGQPVVPDDNWATREALTAAAKSCAKQAQDDIDTWTELSNPGYVAEYTAMRDKFIALEAEYGPVTK